MAVTQAMITYERPVIMAWSLAKGWEVGVDDEALTLTATTTHPVRSEGDEPRPVIFGAQLSGYPAMPPSWRCFHPDGTTSKAAYPVGGTQPGLGSSIFHGNGVICAPWNRLAYGDKGGPHPDWIDAANWKTVDPSATRADTLVDMLSALEIHLAASPGMNA